jgi:hypothetical protein
LAEDNLSDIDDVLQNLPQLLQGFVRPRDREAFQVNIAEQIKTAMLTAQKAEIAGGTRTAIDYDEIMAKVNEALVGTGKEYQDVSAMVSPSEKVGHYLDQLALQIKTAQERIDQSIERTGRTDTAAEADLARLTGEQQRVKREQFHGATYRDDTMTSAYDRDPTAVAEREQRITLAQDAGAGAEFMTDLVYPGGRYRWWCVGSSTTPYTPQAWAGNLMPSASSSLRTSALLCII